MGCGSSKKSLPDRPSEIDCEKIKPAHRNRQSNNKGSGNKKGSNTNKPPKYRTKIDSRVLAKYDIKALIGKGSFSDVLRVENKVTKQPYAVKILRLKTANTRDLFESELAVLRRVRHDNIIQLIEVFESKDCIYLVMELATGGELYDRIKMKGHLNEKETAYILHMVLKGVGYLHDIGVAHRDLKPENVLFYHPGQDSKILITDFGFAKARDLENDLSPFTTWCGTPEYIAPELVWRKPYTCAVDMWAIGVITYVMLSGHLPFAAETTVKLYQQIVRANYSYSKEVWKNLSAGSKDFIDKLLVIDPKQRNSAEQSLRHSWIDSFHFKSTSSTKYSSQISGKSAKSSKSIKYSRGLRSKQRYEDTSRTVSRFSQDVEKDSPIRKSVDVNKGVNPVEAGEKNIGGYRQLNGRTEIQREHGETPKSSIPGTSVAHLNQNSTRKGMSYTKTEKLTKTKLQSKQAGIVQDEFPSAAATEGSGSELLNNVINRTPNNPFGANDSMTKNEEKKFEEMEMENLHPQSFKKNGKMNKNNIVLRNEADTSGVSHLRMPLDNQSVNENSIVGNDGTNNSNLESVGKSIVIGDIMPNNIFVPGLTVKRLHAKSFASLSSAVKSPKLFSGNRDTSFMEKVGQWLEEQRYLDTMQKPHDSKSTNNVFTDDLIAHPSTDSKKYFGIQREARLNDDIAIIGDSKRTKQGYYVEEGLAAKVTNHFQTSNLRDDADSFSNRGAVYPPGHNVESIEKTDRNVEDVTGHLRGDIFKQPVNERQVPLQQLTNFHHLHFRNENGGPAPPVTNAASEIDVIETQIERTEGLVKKETHFLAEKTGGSKDNVAQSKDWGNVRFRFIENGFYMPDN